MVTGTGIFSMNNNTFFAISQAGLSPTSPAATLRAGLSRRLYRQAAQQPGVFTAHEGPANVELDISAVLSAPVRAHGQRVDQQGRGAVIFSGNNTYTGTTTVNTDGGTLVVNTPATVAVSNFTVNPGATLGGNGTIRGTVTAANHGSNLTIGGTIIRANRARRRATPAF